MARKHLWLHLDTENAITQSANYWQALYTIAEMMRSEGLYSKTTVGFDIAMGLRAHIAKLRRQLATATA